MPALTKTSSSRPTPPWRPHNRNSPPQQGKGGNAAAAMTPACPKPTKNQSYAEPVQLSRPEYPSQSPTHHADTQISPITLKSSASKTPREKSGIESRGGCDGVRRRLFQTGNRPLLADDGMPPVRVGRRHNLDALKRRRETVEGAGEAGSRVGLKDVQIRDGGPSLGRGASPFPSRVSFQALRAAANRGSMIWSSTSDVSRACSSAVDSTRRICVIRSPCAGPSQGGTKS